MVQSHWRHLYNSGLADKVQSQHHSSKNQRELEYNLTIRRIYWTCQVGMTCMQIQDLLLQQDMYLFCIDCTLFSLIHLVEYPVSISNTRPTQRHPKIDPLHISNTQLYQLNLDINRNHMFCSFVDPILADFVLAYISNTALIQVYSSTGQLHNWNTLSFA